MEKDIIRKTIYSVVLAFVCIIWVLPVLAVVINSFKVNTFVKTNTFDLPTGEMNAGFSNFVKGMTFGNYPFFKSVMYSVVITVLSVGLILLFTSMAAWYIARVDNMICKIVYFLCVFSMVVPFQMVMFTLSKTADKLKLNTPFTIPIVYLGFGAGLAIFMFVGFVKSIPLEIEEAAAIDGCGPIRTYFRVVVPMLKPTLISVGILELMWVWNDYLLPYLVLDINEYRTIPIHIQYLKGSYGTVDLGATMGNIIDKSYKVMVETKPDAVLVLGDTNSCLSVIGAKRLHIPIFHMEAGNRCKDECLPEETNRRIVDIISDVNMAYSEHARRYLADCGLPKERTYVTGSPMAEVLHQNLAEIEASDIHKRLGLEKGKYILLSAHREENIDTEKNFLSLFTAINKMAEKYDMPILYSCHPRSRKRLEQSGFQLDKRVIQHEPLGFHDYNCLQMNAFAVVSDSGTLPEESSFFTSVGHPFPAICIRTSTERPEALDKACFIIAGIDEKSLLQAVDTAVTLNQNGDYGIPVPDYIEENVSTKVVKIIQSYTGIVNKMVWRKF